MQSRLGCFYIFRTFEVFWCNSEVQLCVAYLYRSNNCQKLFLNMRHIEMSTGGISIPFQAYLILQDCVSFISYRRRYVNWLMFFRNQEQNLDDKDSWPEGEQFDYMFDTPHLLLKMHDYTSIFKNKWINNLAKIHQKIWQEIQCDIHGFQQTYIAKEISSVSQITTLEWVMLGYSNFSRPKLIGVGNLIWTGI